MLLAYDCDALVTEKDMYFSLQHVVARRMLIWKYLAFLCLLPDIYMYLTCKMFKSSQIMNIQYNFIAAYFFCFALTAMNGVFSSSLPSYLENTKIKPTYQWIQTCDIRWIRTEGSLLLIESQWNLGTKMFKVTSENDWGI